MTRREKFGKWVYTLLTLALLAAAALQLADYLSLRTWQGTAGAARYSEEALEEEAARLLEPDSFTVSSGDHSGRMALVTSQTAFFNELFRDSYAYLEEVFAEKDEPVSISREELGALVPACRYLYSCERSSSVLAEALDMQISDDFRFREIWILPLAGGKTGAAAVFVLPGESAFLIQVRENRTIVSGGELQDTIRRAADSLGENYFDSVRAFGDRFAESFPIADQTLSAAYIPWRKVPADLSYEAALQTASRYFAYPELVRGEQYAGGSVFTDDRLSVRISPNGLVDYLQTPSGSAQSADLNRAYALALQFLEEDLNHEETVWETLLESVESLPDGYVFTWNYKIDGIPVLLEEKLLRENGMTGAVEIEVREGAVYHMRRFLLTIERGMFRPVVEEESQLAVLSRYAAVTVSGMDRVYRLTESEAVPYWRIDAGQDVFYEKVR